MIKYRISKMKQRLLEGGLVCSLVLSLFGSHLLYAESDELSTFSPYVDSGGAIHSPDDFQTKMIHLGSWYVPKGDASGFHDVYTEQASVNGFRETGVFPDGTILIKVLRAASTADYTTGRNVSHANEQIKQWFVMIKDDKGRFPDNPNWGDGWGWALFKTDSSGKNLSGSYKNDCLGCHVPAKDKDWVYTEAYPVLRSK